MLSLLYTAHISFVNLIIHPFSYSQKLLLKNEHIYSCPALEPEFEFWKGPEDAHSRIYTQQNTAPQRGGVHISTRNSLCDDTHALRSYGARLVLPLHNVRKAISTHKADKVVHDLRMRLATAHQIHLMKVDRQVFNRYIYNILERHAQERIT